MVYKCNCSNFSPVKQRYYSLSCAALTWTCFIPTSFEEQSTNDNSCASTIMNNPSIHEHKYPTNLSLSCNPPIHFSKKSS
mmetsp:Transcript_30008/g.40035  ORF Transcript_30008/g.40035 Transcript_30008/m.40035 type:complete len:80 (-) Transcript_30008:219-458(-)